MKVLFPQCFSLRFLIFTGDIELKNWLEMKHPTEYRNKQPTARIVLNSILKCNISTR